MRWRTKRLEEEEDETDEEEEVWGRKGKDNREN